MAKSTIATAKDQTITKLFNNAELRFMAKPVMTTPEGKPAIIKTVNMSNESVKFMVAAYAMGLHKVVPLIQEYRANGLSKLLPRVLSDKKVEHSKGYYTMTTLPPLSEVLANKNIMKEFGIVYVTSVPNNEGKLEPVLKVNGVEDTLSKHAPALALSDPHTSLVKLTVAVKIDGEYASYHYDYDTKLQAIVAISGSRGELSAPLPLYSHETGIRPELITEEGLASFKAGTVSLTSYIRDGLSIKRINKFLDTHIDIAKKLKALSNGELPMISYPGHIVDFAEPTNTEKGFITYATTVKDEVLTIGFKHDRTEIYLLPEKTSKKLLQHRIPMIGNFEQQIDGSYLVNRKQLGILGVTFHYLTSATTMEAAI